MKFSFNKLLVHLILLMFVLIWTLPIFGLFVSSLRNKDQLIISGWWSALRTTERNEVGRTGDMDDQFERDGLYVIAGSFFEEGSGKKNIKTLGLGQNELDAYAVSEAVDMGDGTTFTLSQDGTYEWISSTPFEITRGKRIFYVANIPPTFSFKNYTEVLQSERIGQAFLNTFTVAIPATIIPIALAAFAAYAFAWMRFPGRQFLFAVVVGLLVVPLQMSLIPLLKFYNIVGEQFGFEAKSYVGIWLAHTGFGLPLAIYLLRNYIGGLPKDIIESARIDGASHFSIFTRLILPLSVPALASFSIFQFLWTWNDLLVALVFLGKRPDQIVLTSKITELLGSRGDNWEILTSSAFISISVPLFVFFALQRYFVRGLLAGSEK